VERLHYELLDTRSEVDKLQCLAQEHHGSLLWGNQENDQLKKQLEEKDKLIEAWRLRDEHQKEQKKA
jgi:hypothetical protein